MFETPNCRVKPTEASARIDAVTRPNPIDWTKRLPVMPTLPLIFQHLDHVIGRVRPTLLRGCNLRGSVRRHLRRAVGGDNLERAGRVLPPVEADPAGGADVLDCLAVGERGFLLCEVMHDDRGRRWRGQLHDPGPEDTWVRALGGLHGERHKVDAVPRRHAVGIAVPLAGGLADLRLDGRDLREPQLEMHSRGGRVWLRADVQALQARHPY